ncbi:MAG: hypothetical protein M3R00_08165 [Pseudomonadota bacterium]|nr:hypothetical protein [Pseudomonadota bacterium]
MKAPLNEYDIALEMSLALDGERAAISKLAERLHENTTQPFSDSDAKIITDTILTFLVNNPDNYIAHGLLCMLYPRGFGTAADIQKSIHYFEKGIQRGNISAMNNRAFMHLNAIGGGLDTAAAIDLLDRAIDLGSTTAMNTRAEMCLTGRGCDVNVELACKLFEDAIESGNPAAVFERAITHPQSNENSQCVMQLRKPMQKYVVMLLNNLDDRVMNFATLPFPADMKNAMLTQFIALYSRAQLKSYTGYSKFQDLIFDEQLDVTARLQLAELLANKKGSNAALFTLMNQLIKGSTSILAQINRCEDAAKYVTAPKLCDYALEKATDESLDQSVRVALIDLAEAKSKATAYVDDDVAQQLREAREQILRNALSDNENRAGNSKSTSKWDRFAGGFMRGLTDSDYSQKSSDAASQVLLIN